MKKFIAFVAAALCFAAVASAQPKALGIRATAGAEISYQHNIGANFMDLDLGFGIGAANNWLTAVAVYDFNICPLGPLNFYAGPGAYIALWPAAENMPLNAGLVGQIGLEYTFPFPLQLSLDWRPSFNFVGGFGFGWSGFALGIRYAF